LGAEDSLVAKIGAYLGPEEVALASKKTPIGIAFLTEEDALVFDSKASGIITGHNVI